MAKKVSKWGRGKCADSCCRKKGFRKRRSPSAYNNFVKNYFSTHPVNTMAGAQQGLRAAAMAWRGSPRRSARLAA